jgi:hypothetical protein
MLASSFQSYSRPALLLLLSSALLLTQCRKKEVEPQLPPETTTGAMTFGCKIDGRVFVPRDEFSKTGLFAQYVNSGTGRGGGYYLNIPATDWKADPNQIINIGTDSLLVEEGKSYPIMTTKGAVQAFYFSERKYAKLDQDPGELTITRFDRTQGIISGRFHFVGTDLSTGKQVQVTEGRFDVRF